MTVGAGFGTFATARPPGDLSAASIDQERARDFCPGPVLYQIPRTFHHNPPMPIQMMMLITLMIAPSFHQAPIST